jgi:NADPH:quinone reductase-like Zn-dependent oxidoreductase
MKAIVFREYGSPDALTLEEVPRPTPKDDEVLVRVHAASVNSSDWERLNGIIFARLLGGARKPKVQTFGTDVAGTVEAVGSNVSRFKPGDKVLGDLLWDGGGTFAEYVCAREVALAPKSPSMTFEQAAAVPQAAVLALQGLRKAEPIQPGQHVLINGAGGGMGTFAVQIAKSLGAEVTGVDSTRKLDVMRAAGADHVIDYIREDFTRSGERYDLILDAANHHSIFHYRRALNPNGSYVMAGGSTPRILQVVTLGPLISRRGDKQMGLLMHKRSTDDLTAINELFEAGKVTPIIDRCFPLSEVPEALRYFGTEGALGKIVISVAQTA